MIIIPDDGEERAITEAVWEAFEGWYGDKAYRHADFVEELETVLRRHIAGEIAAEGARLREDEEYPISREERDCYDDAARIALGAADG
ncbi:hypothetical protein ACFVHB_20160 [Kitasatospora sp. NPDC127111]|uniref:hypothetical protein n=1 Tax=Kitasatospora sp. NPDC127111 TaxID=3345363 RepID=UPI00362ABAE3